MSNLLFMGISMRKRRPKVSFFKMLFLLLTVVREDQGFVDSTVAVAGAAFPNDSTGYLRSAFQESIEIIRNDSAFGVTWTGMSVNASFDTDTAFQAFCDYVEFPGRRVMVTADTVGMGLGVGGLATQLGIPLISIDNNLDLNSDNKSTSFAGEKRLEVRPSLKYHGENEYLLFMGILMRKRRPKVSFFKMLFLLLTVVREDQGFVDSTVAVAGAAFPNDSTGYLRSAFQESIEIIRNDSAFGVTWTGMSVNASFDTDTAFQAFCDYVEFPGRRVMVTADTVGMGLGVGGLATQLGIPLISIDNNLDLNSDNKVGRIFLGSPIVMGSPTRAVLLLAATCLASVCCCDAFLHQRSRRSRGRYLVRVGILFDERTDRLKAAAGKVSNSTAFQIEAVALSDGLDPVSTAEGFCAAQKDGRVQAVLSGQIDKPGGSEVLSTAIGIPVIQLGISRQQQGDDTQNETNSHV
uniref:Receptor ligand binding region domain-containing protein n=1 Tax=Branchiostoma floridae TaxID=7739 RepID=C3YIH7_BRAFL|eukprot:XP_002603899.1 hypothetical protein BRAFLDRAFT_129999 [Branchiostoma floridae]